MYGLYIFKRVYPCISYLLEVYSGYQLENRGMAICYRIVVCDWIIFL